MSKSNIYITTAIAYVNDKPHIGHAMDFLYADVLARYYRQEGHKVVLGTGVDEHGAKIAEKSAEKGMKPKEYTDAIVPSWLEFTEKLGMSYDNFMRTTDAHHEKTAQKIWQDLSKYIYKSTYVGWYCVGCEEYKTETYVKETENVCPAHNREYEKLEEENYFFALSQFNDEIKKRITDGSFRVIPKMRRNEILSLLNEGLDDISVSRPKSKMSWGIPVPGDKDHVMHVWPEALMNYITVLGYPDEKDFKDFWPAHTQVIGKDILRFHAATWPAMLLALGLELPKTLYVHGHISADGKKMSKSLGNVIDPIEVINKYGLDTFRYFFCRHISSYEDSDFTWEKLDSAYNDELANDLGNALQRVVSMVVRYQNGVIGDLPENNHDIGAYQEALENCRFDHALDAVWDQVKGVNQYLELEKPWEIAKSDDAEHLREVLAEAASSLMEIAELLKPFMPETSKKITQALSEGVVVAPESPLFPRYE